MPREIIKPEKFIPAPHIIIPTAKNVVETVERIAAESLTQHAETILQDLTIASETMPALLTAEDSPAIRSYIPDELRLEVEPPRTFEATLAAPAFTTELLAITTDEILAPVTAEIAGVETFYEDINEDTQEAVESTDYQYEDMPPEQDEPNDVEHIELADINDVEHAELTDISDTIITEEAVPVLVVEAATNQPEVQISPDVSQDYINRSVELTDVIELVNTEVVLTPEVINTLHEAGYEMPVLPAVCLEVSAAIEQLDPEPAEKANELVNKITDTIAAVMLSRETGGEDARANEEMLEQLCIELFEYVGIEYTRETVFEFVMGVMQAQKAAAEISLILREKEDEGTHEIKQDDVQNIGQLAQILQYPLTRTLGTLILQLSHSAAA